MSNQSKPRLVWGSDLRWMLSVALPLALLTALGTTIGLAAALLPAPRYSVEVTLVVRIPDAGDDPEVLVRTTESLVTTRAVLELISDSVSLTPGQIEQRIELERSPGSTVIDITVTDVIPERAEAISVGLLPAMDTRIDEIQQAATGAGSVGGGAEREVTFLPLQVTSPRGVSQAIPVPREPTIFGAVGGAAGLAVGLLILLGRSTAGVREATGPAPSSRRSMRE